MGKPAIKVEGLSKYFFITKERQRNSLKASLSQKFIQFFNPGSVQPKNKIWALQDISFEVKEGEILGIIGNNGAGKSTLLKILAHVMAPSAGQVHMSHFPRAILGVGTGFHPELTGRENVFFNGAILGIKNKELKRRFDHIIDFSGISSFIDTPLKYYSNGMKIRLGFSIAAHLEPQILLLDEVLMVGDEEFKKRSIKKIKEISEYHGCSILFVSHNLGAVRQVCDKGMLLKEGKLETIEEINWLVDDYKEAAHKKVEEIQLKKTKAQEQVKDNPIEKEKSKEYTFDKPNREWPSHSFDNNEELSISSLSVFAEGKNYEQPISQKDKIAIEIKFFKKTEDGILDPTFQLISGTGEAILVTSTAFAIPDQNSMPKGHYSAICQIPSHFLNTGRIYIDLFIHKNKQKRAVYRQNRVLVFYIVPPEMEFGQKYRRPAGPVRPLLPWKINRISNPSNG